MEIVGSFLITKVHFLRIAFFIQFPTTENVFQMLGDDASFYTEKLADSLLCQPDSFVFKKDFNIHLPVVSGVEKEIGLLIREIIFHCTILSDVSLPACASHTDRSGAMSGA